MLAGRIKISRDYGWKSKMIKNEIGEMFLTEIGERDLPVASETSKIIP